MRASWRFALLATAVFLPALAFVAPGSGDPSPADAHPLGNFTINRYSRIEIYSDAVRIRYVLDMAEIPAFQELGNIDVDGDGAPTESDSNEYLATKAQDLIAGIRLTVDGESRLLKVVAQDVSYPEGQGGLRTLRAAFLFAADARGAGSIEYEDGNYADRIGWKEIVVSPAPGVAMSESSVPASDVSQELTIYPDDLLSSPLDVASASLAFDASAGASAPPVGSATTARPPESAPNRAGGGFAGLVDSENLTLTVVALSLLAALGFGAVHALEPGHGKTFVAAYFVGVKGTAREALLLGIIVAATHTIGVFAIGLLTLFGSQYILPEDLYPWLTLASGVMILFLGVRLLAMRTCGFAFIRRLSGSHSHSHENPHEHEHSHDAPGGSPWKGLIALGLADGLTPSPSALVVLLAAVSLDRIGLGILLIVAFSVGLAAVLASVSLGIVYARRVADWLSLRGHGLARNPIFTWATGSRASQGALTMVVPTLGAVALTVVGVLLTVRALPNI
jgi:ABC-type nickel/cobalt efflux system permease component RcnA